MYKDKAIGLVNLYLLCMFMIAAYALQAGWYVVSYVRLSTPSRHSHNAVYESGACTGTSCHSQCRRLSLNWQTRLFFIRVDQESTHV